MQSKFAPTGGLLGLVCGTLVVGCNGCSAPATKPAQSKPFAGATLRVVCEDAAAGKAFAAAATRWAGRTGASVTLAVAPPDTDPTADVVIIRPPNLGKIAVAGMAQPVPAAVRADDATARWSRMLPVSRDRLSSWGPEPLAVPLAGEGYVLVYRADRFADPAHQAAFRGKYGRQLSPPVSWEEIADVAAFFAADGKPSLPPLPNDADRLLREFHFIAACYDRPALTESNIRQEALKARFGGEKAGEFHYTLPAGKPRLTAPAFTAAAAYLAGVQKHRMTGGPDDPVTALDKGTAVVAVVSLAEVGRLPRTGDGVDPRFGVGKLPGTRNAIDPDTGAKIPPPDPATGVNFVPYYGDGGWLGVVRTRCAHADAAFDLLAELCSPVRSHELVSNPATGFGPFRGDQIEPARDDVWQQYGFDPDSSRKLADALRAYQAVSLANPVIGLRGPDQVERSAELAAAVRRAAMGQVAPAEAMKQANDAWLAADAKQPAAAEWRKKAAGF